MASSKKNQTSLTLEETSTLLFGSKQSKQSQNSKSSSVIADIILVKELSPFLVSVNTMLNNLANTGPELSNKPKHSI